MRIETPEEIIETSTTPLIAGGVAAEGLVFRLISRRLPFVAVKVFEHPAAGPCVIGVTEDYTQKTTARVADVVFL